MDEDEWVKVSEAAKYYNVSVATIHRWSDEGKVPSRRTLTNQRRIKLLPRDDGEIKRQDYIYVRVSSFKQKDDLERQKDFLHKQFPQHKIISDVGSGLNYKRPGLLSILESVQENRVGEIVVASKDRLCRFGFELLQWICEQHGSSIMVLERNDQSPEEELSSELLDVIQVFCCRRNGRRRYNNKNTTFKTAVKTPSKENS